jgi:hypothetical protein
VGYHLQHRYTRYTAHASRAAPPAAAAPVEQDHTKKSCIQ